MKTSTDRIVTVGALGAFGVPLPQMSGALVPADVLNAPDCPERAHAEACLRGVWGAEQNMRNALATWKRAAEAAAQQMPEYQEYLKWQRLWGVAREVNRDALNALRATIHQSQP